MHPAHSIRTRLIVGLLIALAAILGAAAWGSYAVSRHESEEIFSARLATSARVLETLAARPVAQATIAQPIVIELPKELELGDNDQRSPYGHPYETKIAFQIWRDDGTLLARSTSAPQHPFGPNEAGFSQRKLGGVLWQVFVLKSGSTWIQVAEKDEVRDELVHDLGIAVMTPLIIGAALLLVTANLLVIYGLAPLQELAARIEERDPSSLGEVKLRQVPRELVPVVQALNDLLQRVRLALEHERRFTDAAAHELRTPLAALKIHADNLVRATTQSERRRSIDQLLRGLERTTKLAEQMLAYSRSQNDSDCEERVPIRLSEAVRETMASMEPLASENAQTLRFTNSRAEDASLLGEPLKIQRLLRNLLDNAIRYGASGEAIEINLTAEDNSLVLSIANHGSTVPAELRERVFDPYYRVPGSRSEGSGLGLAIVKELATRHGASVELGVLDNDQGTVVRVRFPLLAAAHATKPVAAVLRQ